MLQCPAVCCGVLQCVVVCHSVVQCVAQRKGTRRLFGQLFGVAAVRCSVSEYIHCNALQHTAECSNALECIASHCNTLQHTETRCNTLQHTATHTYTHTYINTHTHTHTHRCITHCLYRAIRHRDAEVYKYQTRYHAFSWGMPILLAILPQFANAYGLENGRLFFLPYVS